MTTTRLIVKSLTVLLAVFGFLLLGVHRHTAIAAAPTVPLQQYWSPIRHDNFAAATEVGRQSAIDAGYGFVRTEGYVFSSPQPGTTSLQLYWNAATGDNFITATNDGSSSVGPGSGYAFARTEGYIYTSPHPGTAPLLQYWSADRADNFVTATLDGVKSAYAAGYRFVRIEGYVLANDASIWPELEMDLDMDNGSVLVDGNGFTAGGLAVIYVLDAPAGVWFDSIGTPSLSPVANGAVQLPLKHCTPDPDRGRFNCGLPPWIQFQFTYNPQISVLPCGHNPGGSYYGDNLVVVFAQDYSSGRWAITTYYLNTCIG